MKNKPCKYLKHKGLTIYVDWSIPGELIVEVWGKDSEIKTWILKTSVKKIAARKK